jgi:hypothetical protein
MKKSKKKKPNYRERMKKLEKTLDSSWSILVRSKGMCEKCGSSSSLSAHHAFGRRHRATRWDLYNGVALCYPCHIHWSHRDPCSFAEWFRKRVGDDQYNRLSEAHTLPALHTEEDLQGILSGLTQLN